MTFSAPKSLSILWALCEETSKRKVETAHRSAVEATLKFIEAEMIKARRGAGGKQIEPVKALFACFDHFTSRALDPQIHTHALLMNVGVRRDGTTGTVSSLDLFRGKLLGGLLYRAELTAQLRRLGIDVDTQGELFEIRGVPQELASIFSKRRKQISSYMNSGAMFSNSPKAAAIATIRTRDRKLGGSHESLVERWRDEGQVWNWSTREAEALFKTEPARDLHADLAEIESHTFT